MLPDPLLEPMNTADEDAVCDFIASKLDITLMYERKYIIMGCVCVCMCVSMDTFEQLQHLFWFSIS